MITAKQALEITHENGTLIDDILMLIEVKIIEAAKLGKQNISYYHENTSWRNDEVFHFETEHKKRLVSLLMKKLQNHGFNVFQGNSPPYSIRGTEDVEFTNSLLEITW